MHVALHRQNDHRQKTSTSEGDAPAPCLQLNRCEQELLEEQQDKNGAQLAPDQRHVLEAGIEATVLFIGYLGEVGSARTVFAAQTQALNHAREAEQYRRRAAD